MLFTILLFQLAALAQSFSWIPFSVEGYNHETLQTQNSKSLELYWKLSQNDIEFMLASNNGATYIAMGISETGGMRGSDIWVFRKDESDMLVIETRFAEEVGYPKLLNSSKAFLQSFQSDNVTAFSFKTPINSCDSQLQILDPAVPNMVIFAIGTSNAFEMHAPGNNGNSQVDFTGSFFPTVPNMQQEDAFKLNMSTPPVSLTANETTYCYSAFEFPIEKSHIIIEDPIVGSKYTHHIVGYKCDKPPPLAIGKVDCIALGYGEQYTRYQQVCSNTWMMWAKGGRSRIYPPNAGKPIGYGPLNTTYFLLEVHFANPDMISGIIDSGSGLSLTVTRKLRANDIGMLYLGTLQNFIVLEPRVSRYEIKSMCPAKCLDSLPEAGITPLSYNFHLHARGRAGTTRWIRNGTELKTLANMRYFDFNFQMYKYFHLDHDKILPGDELITSCFWDTSQDTQAVMGGLSSRNEMCTNYLAANLYLCGQTGDNIMFPNKFLCFGVQDDPIQVDPYLDFKPFIPYPLTCGVNDDGNISTVFEFSTNESQMIAPSLMISLVFLMVFF